MTEHFHSTMDRNIFNLDLSTEVTSAYIVVTSLMEQNVRPTLEEIRGRWTASDDELDAALRELIHRRILKVLTEQKDTPVYYPNPANLWRK
jgi:hypothetical protein